MAWLSMSDIVRRLDGKRHSVPPLPDLRIRAGLLATTTFGKNALVNAPEFINMAALVLSMDRIVVHRASDGVTRTVHETDLHSLPDAPPDLLRHAWLIEARHPERQPLFGDTASLGGYHIGDAIYLVGVRHPDGAMVSRWVPQWRGDDLDATVSAEDSPLIDDVDQHREWARQAARFAIVLGLLLSAEGTPVIAKDEPAGGKRRRPGLGEGARPGEWVTRRVYIDDTRLIRSPASSANDGHLDRTGRIEATVNVTGHLKRQSYGPGRKLRKWIYVEGYEARRWVSPRPLRIDVVGK